MRSLAALIFRVRKECKRKTHFFSISLLSDKAMMNIEYSGLKDCVFYILNISYNLAQYLVGHGQVVLTS